MGNRILRRQGFEVNHVFCELHVTQHFSLYNIQYLILYIVYLKVVVLLYLSRVNYSYNAEVFQFL